MLDFSNYEEKVFPVFNDGKAGLAEGCTVAIKEVDQTNPQSPAFKLQFTDSKGRTTEGCPQWELKGTEDEVQLKKLVQNYGQIWTQCMPGVPFPAFTTVRAFFEQIVNSGNKVDVFCNYGTVSNPGKWLNPRKYNFMQKSGSPIPLSQNTSPTNGDNMVRFMPDAEVTETASDMPFGNSTDI